MMAAEANQTNPVDAATPSIEPTITISEDSQDVGSKQPLVNGAASSDEIGNRHLSDIVDDLVNSAEVSVSGGSDTEASKPDGASSKDGDKGHARTSSAVKKPTTFKSVSVNKTFLGNKGAVAAGTTSKPLDKSSSLSTGQSTSGAASAARPRLVAKLGVSRDGSKGSGGAGGKAAAPDPSAVWNKNRPPPVPEPKKFTDEELKKYGIHMTDRLAPGNEAQGQNNWADIDDDDEDWIPGEIQWNDGTKVTIPQVDEPTASPTPAQATPAPVSTSTAVPPKESKQIDKPKSPAPTASPSVKPGVLGSGKGLVLKGAPEKPTLVARPPPPPAPVKSPWATLPPVEKAPPIGLDNAAPQASGRPQIRDGPPAKSMTPPPAKEIAADDFSRSSGPVSHNRELFNSQSGRYEPVTDRRASSRNDPYQRHPAAVLQRPPQGEGPAEPSPAFQTNRPGGQEPPYGRRRGSSNVSGGSGSFFQRMPKPHDQALPPPEVLNARRGSLTSDSPVSPRNFSPSGPRHGAHGPSWHSRTSPHVSHAVPHHGPGPHDPAAGPPSQYPQRPLEDEFELQKKLMAEKLQLARQRKAEEEAKAEAEKQKRIAAKLAALGPAPESRSAKQAAAREGAAAAAAPSASPATAPPAPVPSASQTASSQAQAQHAAAQDGNSRSGDARTTLTRQSTAEADGTSATNAGIATNANGPRSNSRGQHLASGDSRTSPDQEGKQQQASWQGAVTAQHESRFSWGPQPGQTSSRNVWGAPNNNRSLGNGTFSSDLGRVPETFSPHPHQMPITSAPGPGPIAPPGGQKTQSTHPKPIGPPKAAPAASSQRAVGGSSDDDVRSRWVSATIAGDGKVAAEARDRFAQQKSEMEARGLAAEDSRPTYRDSWKPVQLDSEGRRVESKERVQVVHNSAWKPSPMDERDSKPSAPTGSAAAPQAAASAGPSQQTRASRFFPSKDSRPEGPAAGGLNRHQSPSPPPPDMDGHPAFDGDATHPHVALPPSRPVVRLPPSVSLPRSAAPAASSSASASVNSSSSFSWATPKPYQESQTSPTQSRTNNLGAPAQRPTSSWQTKINDLLHDNKPPTSHGRMTVDSTSRGAMDSSAAHNQATVSLPGFVGLAVGDQSSPTSRDMAEECFEEQEMGSLPPVRLPALVADAAWNPAVAPGRTYPKKFWVNPTTAEALEDVQGSFAFVLVPGMARAKRVHLPLSMRSYSNSSRPSRGPRNPGPRQNSNSGRGGTSSGAGPNGPRQRDASMTSYSNETGSVHNSAAGPGSHSTNHTRGRGGFRRSADWGRRAPTPVQT